MDECTLTALKEAKAEWPETFGSGVSADKISQAEALVGIFPQSYRQFLEVFGAGVVAGVGVFGLELPPFMAGYLVTEGTEKFRAMLAEHGIGEHLVIGLDPIGSPICLAPSDSEVLHFDLESGEQHRVADNFDQYLNRLLAGDPLGFV